MLYTMFGIKGRIGDLYTAKQKLLHKLNAHGFGLYLQMLSMWAYYKRLIKH